MVYNKKYYKVKSSSPASTCLTQKEIDEITGQVEGMLNRDRRPKRELR